VPLSVLGDIRILPAESKLKLKVGGLEEEVQSAIFIYNLPLVVCGVLVKTKAVPAVFEVLIITPLPERLRV
jgi:hypothetical protein